MTVFDSFPHLRQPSPLARADWELDDVAEVQVGPRPSSVRLALSSGAEVVVHVTDAAGTLHLHTDAAPLPSALLVDHPRAPVTVESLGSRGVRLRGADWDATWSVGDGLVRGPFRTAPTNGLGGSQPALFGRYIHEGQPVAWLVSADLGHGDAIFGGGESFTSVNHRGRIRRCLNVETHGIGGLDAAYLNVPFFWSRPTPDEPGWGVLAHTGAAVTADLGATHSDVAAFMMPAPELDVFVFDGRPMECLAAYHRLSGLPGRMPEWAFGTWTSRCSYFDEDELHTVIDGYDDAKVPVDVVHVDCWGEGNTIRELTCSWEIDRDRYPAGWVTRLGDRGVKVSLWHNPYVLAGSDLAARLEQDGFLLTDVTGAPCRTPDKTDRVLIDFTNDAALRWWQDNIRGLTSDEGVAAFKPDFAEEVPSEARAADGRTGTEIRNEYSVRYQHATHDVLATDGDGAAALFCRSGTTGAQRYPCHWVGDTPSTWAGLTQALRACLSLSLTGFGVVTSDAGGFYVDGSWERMFAAADAEDGSLYEPDVDPDLFLRWTQWAAFSPVLRFHGTGRREPWVYPEPHASLAGDAVRIRARLRPYLEHTAEQCAASGIPMMRPLALTEPRLRGVADSLQYLLGDDMLVAPLLDPAGQRDVYVPAGDWEPVLGLDPVEGAGWTPVSCSLEQFPVWVRHGSSASDLLG